MESELVETKNNYHGLVQQFEGLRKEYLDFQVFLFLSISFP